MKSAAHPLLVPERRSALWALRQMLSKRYRARVYAPVALMLVAVAAETVGIGAIWPVLMLATDSAPTSNGSFAVGMQKFFASIGGPPSIEVLLLVVFFSIAVKAAVSLAGQQLVSRGTALLAAEFRSDLMAALMAARWNYTIQQSTGAIANAISADAPRAAGIFAATVNLLTVIAAAIPFAVIALSVSWQMTIGALLVSALIMFLLRSTLTQTRRHTGELLVFSRSLITRLVDGVVSLKAIKAMDLQDRLWPFLASDVTELATAERKQSFSKNFQMAIQEPLVILIICVGLYVALKKLNLGIVEISFMVVVFQRLVTRFVGIQNQIHTMATSEVAYISYADHVAAAVAAVESSNSVAIGVPAAGARLRREIELKNVSLSYPGRPLFNDLSLRLPAGQLILIIGPSGAGKTSLVDTITGLQWPQSGSVSVDGVDLNESNIRSWRQHIGYVPQELQLLNGSIFDNVSLMDDKVTRQDVQDALETAGVWDFVSGLPDGMDSMAGERGTSLSGGQRQRIAIARALVRKPDLLILDEATTALDPQTEQSICDRLSQIVGPMTILAISHQAALIDHADLVLRVEGGNIEVAQAKSAIAAQ